MPKNDEIRELEARERELERQLRAIREKRALVEGRVQGSSYAPASPKRTFREVVLDLLAEAGTPLNSLLIASVLRPLTGRSVASTRFGSLSKDEQASYTSARPRAVYLCHCLTYEDGQAVKRMWARSDWPLAARIVGPRSGRLIFLKGAAWTVRLARDHANRAVDADTLNYVAADQARDAGAKVIRGEFHHDEWLQVIEDQIRRLGPDDEAVRTEAADRLQAKLSEEQLLFGARPPFVSLPGSSPEWRSANQ